MSIDRFGIRSFKCAMAFVLATGMAPTASALADEAEPAAVEETATPDASEASGEEASTADAPSIDSISDATPDTSNESPAQPNTANDSVVANEATDNASATELSGDDSAVAANSITDEPSEQSTASNEWQTWGTCEWMVDSQGCLTIRPANGADEGQLPERDAPDYSTPWHTSDVADRIETISIAEGVKAAESCRYLFDYLPVLKEAEISNLDTSAVTDMHSMFDNCTSLTSIDVSGWDTSSVTSMEHMFRYCSSLTSLDISKWDVSTVTYAGSMFRGCTSLASLDVSKWDTSNMQSMDHMFCGCDSLVGIDVSRWITSSAASIQNMFNGCTSLMSLDLSNWNTSNASTKYDVLSGCSALCRIAIGEATAIDFPSISKDGYTGRWLSLSDSKAYEPSDVPVGIPSTYIAQKELAPSLFSIDDSHAIYTGRPIQNTVTSEELAEGKDYSISYSDNVNAGTATVLIDGEGLYIGQQISLEFTIKKATPSYTAPSLIEAEFGKQLSDLTLPDGFSWQDPSASVGEPGEHEFPATYTPEDATNYETVRNIPVTVSVSVIPTDWQTWGSCEWMVDDQGCLTIRPADEAAEGQLPDTSSNSDAIPWHTSEIRPSIKTIVVEPGVKASASCSALFANLRNLEEADLSHLDTANTTTMSNMFAHCSSLTSLDLSEWDTSKVTDMTGVFFCCSSLASLNVTNWDTSKATDMAGVFYCCFSLVSLDVSGWNTSKVTDMGTMFYGCKSLASADVSEWDTSSVDNMHGTFMGCSTLASLDVSGWDTSNATSMCGTFYDCSSVTSLDISRWDVSRVTDMREMFKNCTSLTSLDLSGWDASRVSSTADMLSGSSNLHRIALSDKLACNIPAPSFKGATGLWVNAETGSTYKSNAVPKNAIGTYDAQITVSDDMFAINASGTIYDGSAREPAVTSAVVPSGSYSVSYRDNINAGQATAVVTGLGAYTGTCELKFEISKATPPYTAPGPIDAKQGQTLAELALPDGFSWQDPSASVGEAGEHEFAATYTPADTANYEAVEGVPVTVLVADDSVGWQTYGTCEWRVDDQGCLTIRPANGAVEGQIYFGGPGGDQFPWRADSVKSTVKKITIEKGVKAPGYCTNLFRELTNLEEADLSNLDTSNTSAMIWTFLNCPKLSSVNASEWDTSNFKETSWMFQGCTSLDSLDLSGWDVSGITDMQSMFQGCSRLSSVDISGWSSFGAANMSYVFAGCASLRTLDVSSWDVSKVTNMQSAFSGCKSLKSLNVSAWDTSSVKTMGSLFYGCTSLRYLDTSKWDTSSVADMSSMFGGCSSLHNVDVSGWDTSSVTGMSGMFYGCKSLSALDVSGWNTSSVSNMQWLFNGCSSLTSLDLDKWDVSGVTDMSYMFENCSSLASLAVSAWNTSRTLDMHAMFWGCSALKSLDLSQWNVSSAINMQYMFNTCRSLKTLNVSKWNTANVTEFGSMFANCDSLVELDLSGWNTDAAVGMDGIFTWCNSLERLDLSGFNTTEVDCASRDSYNYPFYGCNKLKSISISDKFTCDMPTPSFEGATGLWVDAATGAAYEPDAVPKNTAGVYDAQTKVVYAHSGSASQNGVTFTVQWNDVPAGQATTFHVTQTGGSPNAKARMDVPTYHDTDGSQESVCDPSRNQWSGVSSYKTIGDNGYDFTFEFTASGSYNVYFYFMDTDNNVGYLRTTDVWTSVNDASHPSVSQIVSNAVTQAKTETDGSEYAMALWLHDWTLDQLEYDHDLNWCSAESGLTRHQGTCESYQRIYAKLLNAAGIANGRITGNGHTWNAAKIDGKWCQMDLTWDDTNDNWYGDLDQRHLYFGLTDELMAIAHSDHTKNYQAEGYAYRSTDLSNNYFARNGKADEWAAKYADRIQQHLDAKETSFSIDADNGTFPPSISGIQNAIIAYAMNQRDWSTAEASVTLAATSNVVVNSSTSWTVRYDVEAGYSATTYYVKYYLSENCSALVFEDSAPFDSPYALKGFSELTGSGEQATCFMGWKMRRDSDGKWFARNASGARFVALNDGKLPDGFSFVLVKDAGKLLKAASAGSGVSLYAQLKDEDTYQIKYYPSESGSEPIAEQVVPYSRSAPIASLSSLGLSDDSSSFKGWKMRRSSDGKWFAQDQAGIKRYVGLIDGKLPDGYDYCLLKDGANLLRAASVGSSVRLYAVMDSPSYVVEYFSAGDAGEPVKSVVAPYATAYQLESIESLGLLGDGKTFVGWKLHRVADDKWYAVSNGKTRYVSLVDGELPAGYSYRLVRDEGNLLKAAPQGTTLQLFTQWE